MRQFTWILAIIILSGIGFAMQLGPETQNRHLQAGDELVQIECIDLHFIQDIEYAEWKDLES